LENPPPALVISGSKDTVITPGQIRAFKARMEAAGNSCQFSEYQNAGHGFFNYGWNGVGSEYLLKALPQIETFLAGSLRTE
jgi:acetyl esterase/lipase